LCRWRLGFNQFRLHHARRTCGASLYIPSSLTALPPCSFPLWVSPLGRVVVLAKVLCSQPSASQRLSNERRPNIHALPQIRQRTSGSGVSASLKSPNFSLSLRAWVLHPNTRRHVRLHGPCFKTGRLKPFRQHPKHVAWANPDQRRAAFLDPRHRVRQEAITQLGCHIPLALFRHQKSMLAHQLRSAPCRSKAESQQTRLTSSVSLSTISRTV